MIQEKPQVTNRKRRKKSGYEVGKWGKISCGLPVVLVGLGTEIGPHGVNIRGRSGQKGRQVKSLEREKSGQS